MSETGRVVCRISLLGNYPWKAERVCISARKKGTGIDLPAANKNVYVLVTPWP